MAKGTDRIQLNAWVTVDQATAIREAAHQEGRSVSNFLTRAAIQAMNPDSALVRVLPPRLSVPKDAA